MHFWRKVSDLFRAANEYSIGTMHIDDDGRTIGDGQIAIHLSVCRHENVVSGNVKHHYSTTCAQRLLIDLVEVRLQHSYRSIDPENCLVNMQHLLNIVSLHHWIINVTQDEVKG